jgi:hypothetical protein
MFSCEPPLTGFIPRLHDGISKTHYITNEGVGATLPDRHELPKRGFLWYKKG